MPDETVTPLIAPRRSQPRRAMPRQAAPPPPVGGCPATPDMASSRRASAGRRGVALVVEEHRMSVRTAPPPLRIGRAAARDITSPGTRSVAGAFLVLMMGFGAAYSFAAFAVPIQAELGLSRIMVSIVVALSGATTYLVSLLSGPIADRAGARWPVSLGIVLVALGLALASTAESAAALWVHAGLLLGTGLGFINVPAMAAVQRHFTRRRGMASGLASSGIGVGTVLIAPTVEVMSHFGDWRLAFLLSAGLVLAVGLAGATLLENRTAPVHDRQATELRSGPRRRRAFAMAWWGVLLVSVPIALPFAHLVPFALDRGLGVREAVGLLTLIGITSVVSRVLLGALADGIGRRGSFIACCAGAGGAMLLWAIGGIGLLPGFALVFGIVNGGFVGLLSPFIADTFGADAAGTVIGRLTSSRALAALTAPVAMAASGPEVALCVAGAAGFAGALLLAGAVARD